MLVHSSKWKTLLAAALLAALAGCASVRTTSGGAVGVEREQTMLVSAAEMNRGAEKSYANALRDADRKGLLNADAAQTARVRAIAHRLIPATAVFRHDARAWRWEVNVIDSGELNAWCMPGGKIAVYGGLIEKLHASDDELAAVMGHEIAHALREHARERASQAVVADIGLTVVGIAAGIGRAGMDLASLVTDITFKLPNSREHETEADRIGVELAARAGYDPYAAVTLWEKMSRAGNGGPPQWLSTHPSHASRIADLRAYAARVRHLYEAAR